MKINIHKIAIIGALFLSFLIIGGIAWGGDILGGYVDSEGTLVVLTDNGGLVLGTANPISLGPARPVKAKGRLIIIYTDGRYAVSSGVFRDNMGAVILPPSDNFDKVVYLDHKGNINGGVGLSGKEIRRMMGEESAGLDYLLFGGKNFLSDGLKNAAEVLKETAGLPEEERIEIFLATLHMTAGKEASQLVGKIIENADGAVKEAGFSLEDLGVSTIGGNGTLPGVGLVSQGGDGDGGTSQVAQGGDGGGGTARAQGGDGDGGTAMLAQGGDGDGGTSQVAQGGDGGGGTAVSAVSVQGWSETPEFDIPVPDGLSALCRGNMVIF